MRKRGDIFPSGTSDDAEFLFTRRRVILAAAGFGLSAGLPAPAVMAEERILRIGYLFAKESHLGAGTTAFGNEVATRTGGRYRIEAYPNGTLGGEVEMVEELQRGNLDIAFLTNAPFGNIIPELGLFDLPFLIRDAAHAHKLFDGPLGREYLAKFPSKGLVGLAWGENGMRHITNSKHPVTSLADLKGLKLRVPQSDVMIAGFSALGVDAKPLAFPALYSALQAGQFDGQENPMAVIVASHFERVQKYLTLTGHVYSWAVIVVSRHLWETLSESDRQAFVEAAVIGGQVSRDRAGEAERSGVDQVRQQGMQVTTSIDRAPFEQAMAPTMAQFAQKYGQDIFDRVRAVQ